MPYPVLTLKSGKDRAVRNMHPWVYSGAVKNRPQAAEGDIVAISDNKGEVLGWGHYSKKGTIICRIFSFAALEPVPGQGFIREKLRAALALRQWLLESKETTGYRLVHAEGDSLPGLIIDIYGEVASLQLRTAGMTRLLPEIRAFLEEDMNIRHSFVREGAMQREEGEKGTWLGEAAEAAPFLEHGLRFEADPEKGQKTGFFLDQRDNRLRLKEMAAGRQVLNTFAYSGAFSVYALAGQAKTVTSVDISAAACEACEKHVAMNFEADMRHEVEQADVFQYLKQVEKGHYDLILLDPPAFTKHKSTVDRAARGYKEINMKAISKVQSGGLIFTFSCSQHISRDLFRKIVFGAAADARRQVRILRQLDQAPDHPVSLYHPEGEYLKGLILHVE